MARQILVVLALIGVTQAGFLGGGLGPGYSTQSIAYAAPTIGITKVLAEPAVSSQSIQRISQSSAIPIATQYIAEPAIATKVLAQPAISSQSVQRISLSSGILGKSAIGLEAAPVAIAAAPLAVATKYLAAPTVAVRAEPVDLNPQYKYSYSVQDPHTGDVKSASEVRDGNLVKGQYSLIDSDGTRRVVDYLADSHNGFNAIVRKEPLYQKIAVAAPVAITAPVSVTKTAIGLNGLGLGYGLGYGYGLGH